MRRITIVFLALIACAIPLSCTSNGRPTTAGRADAQEDLNPQLLHAVQERDVEKVRALLKQGADINTTARTKKEGPAPALSETWTPLHLALMMGNEPMARLLIENGADIKRIDRQGNTPLHFAARWQTTGPARLLLSRSADPNAKDRNGITPLHVAATREIVALLIKHGATPATINEAVNYHRDPAIVQDLVNAGGRIEKQVEDDAASLLSAARLNNKQMVESYLAKGVPVNAHDADGRTAMHEAAKTGYVGMVQLLIEKDNRGQTVFLCFPVFRVFRNHRTYRHHWSQGNASKTKIGNRQSASANPHFLVRPLVRRPSPPCRGRSP